MIKKAIRILSAEASDPFLATPTKLRTNETSQTRRKMRSNPWASQTVTGRLGVVLVRNRLGTVKTASNRFLRIGLSPTSHRRSRISRPAAIASTASTVVTVVETRILSSGKSPVRINQMASSVIPRFLPARVLVIANLFLSSPTF